MLNPVLRREMITSLRSWRVFYLITFYVLMMLAIVLIFSIQTTSGYYSGFNPKTTVSIYTLLMVLQLCIALATVPGITGSSISGERERQTLDLMLITKMTPMSIIRGKLLSSLMIVSLMFLATIPVLTILFFYGGVGVTSILLGYLYIFSVTATIASVAIFFSTLIRRTVITIVLTYMIIVFLSLGTLVIPTVIFAIVSADYNFQNYEELVKIFYIFFYFNPFAALISLLNVQSGEDNIASVVQNLGYWGYSSSSNKGLIPIWLGNTILNVVISTVMIFLSSHLIKPTRKSLKNKG